MLNARIVTVDRIAYEYDLFGDFACDLVVGDSVRGENCFIEFEDVGPRSVFVRRGRRSTPEWSPRSDHGFSQIIDWFSNHINLYTFDELYEALRLRLQNYGLSPPLTG